ncbi:dihydrofolate reductase family protein [Halomicronema sp. CCY15110]|uniref:dihydrofolate reductase family protein n=1 Tax=Halomicronema sp. CCY15110 TaxID=2767773 RepID=UPI00194F5A28|nr:dihydrofolate reductase family protein [Halomicronema sp. CCY15110]
MPQPPQFILYIATTLDGYIASVDGGIDWLTELDVGSADVGYEAFYHTIEALVMGATTYEQVLTFGDWPYAQKPSYVMTRRSLTSDRADVTFVPDVETLLAEVEHSGCQRVWLVGGGQVAAEFMRRGLVHEWIVAIAPVILGDGVSLYQNVPFQPLRLINSRQFQSGLVELHYQQP